MSDIEITPLVVLIWVRAESAGGSPTQPSITMTGFAMPWRRNRRAMEPRPSAAYEVISMLGDLHHRYTWRKAA
jgi:hypothetical protein